MIFDYVLVFILTVLAGGWSIPAGIQFGLEPLGVYVAAVLGSITTSVVFLSVGGPARDWAADKLSKDGGGAGKIDKATDYLERWGLPGFAIVGGTILGPTVTLASALILGLDRRRFGAWYIAGTIGGFALLTLFWAAVL